MRVEHPSFFLGTYEQDRCRENQSSMKSGTRSALPKSPQSSGRHRRHHCCDHTFLVRFLFVAIGLASSSLPGLVAAWSVCSPCTIWTRPEIASPLFSSTMVNNDDSSSSPVILLIGSVGLDRLLTVAKYPDADAKIRTLSYNEEGGGNSANTASAIGKLLDAGIFSEHQSFQVQFLSKVGDDTVGRQLVDELHASNVETSSCLFRRGSPHSTTAFTTVIVSESEQTRTCIHTPGTSGELSLEEDVASLSPEDLDEIFRNVVHLHSDSRHTDVSLWMAKEAKRRGIIVSCDCEKDRNTKALDELIDVCDVLFTNSNHLGDYLQRLTLEKEESGRKPLPEPTIEILRENGEPANLESLDPHQKRYIETIVRSLEPSTYFARWQNDVVGKQVVVTHGAMGALHYRAIDCSKTPSSGPFHTIQVQLLPSNQHQTRIQQFFCDETEACVVVYEVHHAGVLKNPTIVDTTGAGDAFIGGYILTSHAEFDEEENNNPSFALEMGSFVGGKKLGGPGARSALPTGRDVDDLLGSTASDARVSLRNMLTSFQE